ncbi:MAG: helix-turn-helix domain-containing protein [Eubacterium sp.]|nr:helix-turn-helix domain-containing protein [Eubacterium sp.]
MDKEYNRLIGKKLRYCRKTVNITQKQMGEIISVNARQISRYENGETIISVSTLSMFALAFEIPMEDFANEYLSLDNFKEWYPEAHFKVFEPTYQFFWGER